MACLRLEVSSSFAASAIFRGAALAFGFTRACDRALTLREVPSSNSHYGVAGAFGVHALASQTPGASEETSNLRQRAYLEARLCPTSIPFVPSSTLQVYLEACPSLPSTLKRELRTPEGAKMRTAGFPGGPAGPFTGSEASSSSTILRPTFFSGSPLAALCTAPGPCPLPRDNSHRFNCASVRRATMSRVMTPLRDNATTGRPDSPSCHGPRGWDQPRIPGKTWKGNPGRNLSLSECSTVLGGSQTRVFQAYPEQTRP